MLNILLLVFAIQIAYWFIVFGKFALFKNPKNIAENKPSVSVIVCAKNEYNNLKKNINSWLQQKYNGKWQLIIVNDNSTDDSMAFLKTIAKDYNNLKVLNNENSSNLQSKKQALSFGIKNADYEVLLLTDADCQVNDQWITHMVGKLGNNKQIVLGYGPYKAEKGFLNLLIRWETFLTAVQYFSFALWGKTYMGVGRNLLYAKNIFHGFGKHESISSGDDDLHIAEIATANNVSICVDKESFTYSNAAISWKDWYKQKNRHLSTSKYYKWQTIILLSLFSFSHFIFWCLAFYFIFKNWALVITLTAVRWLIMIFVAKKINKHLQEPNLISWLPLLDLVFIFYYLIFSASIFAAKQQKWKNHQ